ncbi:acyl-CoA dehydrogenase family protein [Phenylobacterium sp.]|uniref:acyl-CoA dehydrogenase family protein n=1 Tax=Phenylobacterium sp. TaxID=1871053 RepID=UPI0035B118FD
MAEFAPPVADYLFLFDRVLHEEFRETPGSQILDIDTIAAVLNGMGRFAVDQVAPLARTADARGCWLENGQVRTSPGLREAHQALMEQGWGGLHVATEDGGQGLPISLTFAADDILSSGGIGFALYGILSLGVYRVLRALPETGLDPIFRAKLASGAWAGTMCLTEPHCGTDLSLIHTSATPAAGGTYRLSGVKVFISGGDHDLTDNIVHLVLARVAGGPPGLAGLGLFVAPKFSVDAAGNWSRPNGVRCARLEDKLGLHASATAELVFDEAEAWMVAAPGQGLAGMFQMMKMARVGTPFQAIGAAEMAAQIATAYAGERRQGRDVTGEGARAPVPIYRHPNVRRDLLRMRVLTSSARMFALLAATALDACDHADARRAAAAEQKLSVLMPISKAICSEIAVEVATTAMRTLGGHGYMRDNLVEGLLRDVQVLPIYEGTNDIQALDLVLRRIPAGSGKLLDELLLELEAELEFYRTLGLDPACLETASTTLALARTATQDLAGRLTTAPFSALQAAKDYLWLLAHAWLAVLWLRVLAALRDDPPAGLDPEAKAAEAHFYFAYLGPDAELHAARLRRADQVEASLRRFPAPA